MADASIMKEFLIALGFQVDETSFKKFDEGVKNIEKGVEKLGLAVTALAVGVSAAVVKVGEQFEDLYYASERLHDSVENVQAFTFALGQVGGTGAGARAALESIESFLRRFGTGGDAFFKNLGISTRDANGQLRGATELMGDLAAKFRAMAASGPNGYARANAMANVLGIDEPTLLAMIRGTDQFSKQYHDAARRMGIDQDASAKSMHNLMNQVRTLQMEGSLLFQKIALDLGTRLMPALQQLERWFERNGSLVADRLEAGAIQALDLALSFGRMAGEVVAWLVKLDASTGGWSTKLIELALAIRFLGLGSLVSGLLEVASALPRLIKGFASSEMVTGAASAIRAACLSITASFEGVMLEAGVFAEGIPIVGEALSALALGIGGTVLAPFALIGAAIAAVGVAIWTFRDQIGAAFSKGVADVKAAIGDVMEAFGELTGGSDGLLGVLRRIGSGAMWLGGILIRFLGSEIVAIIIGAFRGIVDEIHMLADVIRLIADVLHGHWSKAWKDAGKLGGDIIHALLDDLRTLRDLFTAPWTIKIDKPKPGQSNDQGTAPAPKSAAHHWWDWLGGKKPAASNDNRSQTPGDVQGDFTDGSPRSLGAVMRALTTSIQKLNEILLGGSANPDAGDQSAGPPGGGAPSSGSGVPVGLRNNNPGNLRRWGNAPIVGGFAQFQSAAQGLSAMAGNLLSYSRHGLDNVSAIISKWAPSKDHNNTLAYVQAVARELQVRATDHLNLLDPETLAKLMAAIVRHENGRQPFGMDAMRSVANARLGADGMVGSVEHHHHHEKSISVSAPTTVTVSGSGQGAYQTARDVASAQTRVYGDLLRNTKSAVA